jgi:hypothetical protein
MNKGVADNIAAVVVSSAIAETVTAPLRVLLVEDQAHGEEFSSTIRIASDPSNIEKLPLSEVFNTRKYIDIIIEIYNQDGIFGLLKGNGI